MVDCFRESLEEGQLGARGAVDDDDGGGDPVRDEALDELGDRNQVTHTRRGNDCKVRCCHGFPRAFLSGARREENASEP